MLPRVDGMVCLFMMFVCCCYLVCVVCWRCVLLLYVVDVVAVLCVLFVGCCWLSLVVAVVVVCRAECWLPLLCFVVVCRC